MNYLYATIIVLLIITVYILSGLAELKAKYKDIFDLYSQKDNVYDKTRMFNAWQIVISAERPWIGYLFFSYPINESAALFIIAMLRLNKINDISLLTTGFLKDAAKYPQDATMDNFGTEALQTYTGAYNPDNRSDTWTAEGLRTESGYELNHNPLHSLLQIQADAKSVADYKDRGAKGLELLFKNGFESYVLASQKDAASWLDLWDGLYELTKVKSVDVTKNPKDPCAGKTEAMVGGATSMAGIGAMIGGAGGPIGTIAGAIVGGLAGLVLPSIKYQGCDNQQQQQQQQ